MSDDVDILDQTSQDCNDIPDSCDIASGVAKDLKGNSALDECETDCNNNDLPDTYEMSQDQNADCNGNGLPDDCDIDSGIGIDLNHNFIPDSCEPD